MVNDQGPALEYFSFLQLPAIRSWLKVYLGSILILASQITYAQSDQFFTQTHDIILELVDLPEGEVIKSTEVIIQDSMGSIWIGTTDGLLRYDGHRLKHFFHDPNMQGSISHNSISSIYQNEPGHLWVGTYANGLNKLNLATDSSRHYLNSMGVNIITGFSDGNVWLGTNEGIFCLNTDTDSHSQFLPHPTDDTEGKNHVWALMEDSNNTIWVGTGPLLGGEGGLYSFEKDRSRFVYHKLEVDGGEHYSNIPVISLLEDSDNNLWVGTSRGLLFRKNLATDQIEQIFLDPPLDSSTWIANLFEDLDRNVWIATVSQGLYMYDSESDLQKHFAVDSDQCPLYNDIAWCITQSRDSVFWLGSAKKGEALSKFYLDPPIIQNHGTPGYSTYSFVEGDEPGVIWIGTDNGLILYDLDDGIQRHYPTEVFLPLGTRGVVAHSLCRDSKGNIWAALVAKRIEDSPGLMRFNPYSEEFTIFSYHDGDDGSLTHNWVFDLMIDSRDRIWVGTHGGGLNLFDPVSGRFIHYKYESDNLNSLEADYIIALFEDRDGKIWITGYLTSVYPAPGHQRIKFINSFSPEQETFSRVRLYPPFDRTNRSYEGISQDADGHIWLQSRNDGLMRLDPQGNIDHVFKPFNSSENVVNSIMVNDEFWIIREHSVFRCDPSEQIISTDVIDYGGSVQEIDQFYFSTSKLTKRNTILMGGDQYFYELDIKRLANTSPASVVFSEFQLLSGKNTDRVELQDALRKQALVLSHQENNFTVNFFLPDYRHPDGNIFEYKLDGFDDRWQHTLYMPEVTYRQLPPNEYKLKVRALGYRTDKSKESSLSIIILPPWSQRWWAYTLYLLIGLLVLTSAYLIQRRRWLLQTQLQLEQEKASRLRELDEFKNRFYTNITHEFRTPLTVIEGMADHILGQEKVKGLIKRNSDQLLTMVNQLLDLTKVESGNLSIDWVHGDIIPYLQYLTESCHSLAVEKKISLSFFAKEEMVEMDFDENIIQHILINLISNAIKFTPEYGSVKLTVDARLDGTAPQLEISVRDTGVGIPAGELEHIFNRFYQIDHNLASTDEERESPSEMRQGSGIGLALVKELVQILEGRVEVESGMGKGSTFTVFLPIHQEATKHFNQADHKDQHPGDQFQAEIETLVKPEPSVEQKPEVLIIEDNSDVREYIKMVLQSKYVLHTARNGKEGVSKAKELVPDVIISDVMMPEMDGFEVCRVVKSDRTTSHIPVILLTAKATIQDKISGLERGADAYLTKPFNKDELLLRIENLLSLTSKLRQRLSDASTTLSEIDGLEKSEVAFIKEVDEVIECSLQNEMFDTNQLCRSMAMSRTQLHRKLKALTGQATASYIRTVKLRKARMLLEKTDQSIAEVATEVGYKDPSHFSRSFMKEFGVLPSETRR